MYAGGYITGNEIYDFGNGVTTASDGTGANGILVKYNLRGNPQWAASVVTAPGDSSFHAVDGGYDGVYAAGYITGNGTYDFGNSVTIAGGGTGANLVLIKYNAGGNPQWARSVTSGPNESCFYAIIARFGSVYAAGYITGNGTYDFGNGVTAQSSGAGINGVLVKYDPNGDPQWVASIPVGPDDSCFNSITAHMDGILATGYITGNGTYDFGNGVTAAGGGTGTNGVLVKYDESGNPQWATSIVTAPGDSSFLSIAVLYTEIYAAGYVTGNVTYDFGSGVTVSGGGAGTNGVLIKYDESGNPQWARSVAAGLNDSMFNSIAIRGNICAVGYITGNETYNFGTGMLGKDVTVTGKSDGANIVLVSYNIAGLPLLAKSVKTGPDESSFQAIASNAYGIYTAGYITGNETYDFGHDVTVAGGFNNSNCFVVRYE
ncbi:MAG: hypothetical protein A2176_03435 [Spirochaetes bacterium RBG_13_51_14]|nr:MAG: hypothetical protein A2176_03435 [Spirochaetes bacterium RBG_13_51_14]